MNILIFYQYFGTPKGGWSTRVYENSLRWVKEGHKITVVTCLYDKSDLNASGFIQKQEIDGINVIIINIIQSNKHHFLRRLFTFFTFSVLSCYYALFLKYEMVICSSGPLSIGLPGLLAKKIRGKKFIFEVRDLWPDGAIDLGLLRNNILIKLMYRFESLCYRMSDLIVSCSKGMTGSISNRFPEVNIITIPNASDPIFRENINNKKELPELIKQKSYFLYAGSIGLMDDCKQIISGIETYNSTYGKDLNFIFIGEGKEKEELRNYCEVKNLNNIFFLDLMPKTELIMWVQNSVANFVNFKNARSLQTSSPNKLFDAFAAGIPVIQNTTGWIKELIENEDCGINVQADNSKSYAEAIHEIQEREIRKNKASNALRLGLTLFDRDHLAKQYLNSMEAIR